MLIIDAIKDYLEEKKRVKWARKSEQIRKKELSHPGYQRKKAWNMVNTGPNTGNVGSNNAVNRTVDGRLHTLDAKENVNQRK